MNKTCFVDIIGGFGNILQSLPFVKELRNYYDVVIGNCRPDFYDMLPMISHHFDKIESYTQRSENWFRCPYEIDRSNMSFSEYKRWFKQYNIKYPEKFDVDIKYDENVLTKFDVLIWPGCKKNFIGKQWPYWNQLSMMFDNVAIIGLPNDGGSFNPMVTDLRGNYSLYSLGGLIKNAKFVIGNEGGITHYSAAINKTVFAIMGNSDPYKNLPPNDKVVHQISLNLDCQPCDNNAYGERGCNDLTCLRNLTPQKVFENISKTLSI